MDAVEESSDRANGKELESVEARRDAETGELQLVDDELDTSAWDMKLGKCITEKVSRLVGIRSNDRKRTHLSKIKHAHYSRVDVVAVSSCGLRSRELATKYCRLIDVKCTIRQACRGRFMYCKQRAP